VEKSFAKIFKLPGVCLHKTSKEFEKYIPWMGMYFVRMELYQVMDQYKQGTNTNTQTLKKIGLPS